MDRATFEDFIREVLDGLPREFARHLDTVPVVVEDRPDARTLRELGMDPRRDTLFGLFDGVPLTEHHVSEPVTLPSRIILYYEPLVAAFPTRSRLQREIERTIIHELGHYFGMEDDEIDRLGYS